MGEFSRTWWGQKFITAIESFTDAARLGRGRSYARGKKILDFAVNKGEIEATVRGSVNPYFGVYKEPRYHTVSNSHYDNNHQLSWKFEFH